MKKLLVLLFELVTISIFAQNDSINSTLPFNEEGKVCFTHVVIMNNQLSGAQIFENIKEWISTKSSNFNRSNSEKNFQGTEVWLTTTKKNFAVIDALYQNDNPLRLSDKESLKIIGRIINKYTGSNLGCIRVFYLEYDLIIRVKDGRFKYEITNFTYNHYNQATGKQSQIYGWKDEGPCKSKGDLNGLLDCDKCPNEFDKFYNYLKDDISNFVKDMVQNVDKKSTDETW